MEDSGFESIAPGVGYRIYEEQGERVLGFEIHSDKKDKANALTLPILLGAGPLVVFLSFFYNTFRQGNYSFIATELACGIFAAACGLWCKFIWDRQPDGETLTVRRSGGDLVMENGTRPPGKARRIPMGQYRAAWMKQQYMKGALMYAHLVLSSKSGEDVILAKETILAAPLSLETVSKLAAIHSVILRYIGSVFPDIELGYTRTPLIRRVIKRGPWRVPRGKGE
ncbi:MAG: hypothetical protein ABIJ86_14190 [Spirochaetota bacterium]